MSMYNPRFNSIPAGLLNWLLTKKHKHKDENGEIEHYFIHAEVVDKRPSKPIKPQKHIILFDEDARPIEIRDYQLEAVDAFIQAERGMIKVPARGGKTTIAAAIIKALKIPKTLFVVNSKTLLNQSIDELSMRLQEAVGIIGNSKWNPSRVTVASVKTLHDRIDECYVQDFLADQQFIIFDESHSASTMPTKVGWACKNAHYRLGLTATPLMGDKESKLQQMALTGSVIYDISMKELVNRGNLAKPTMFYLEMNENPDVPLEGSSWDILYRDGIIFNEKRNLAIILSAVTMVQKGFGVLLLVERIEHGEIFLNLCKKYAEDLNVHYISGMHGSDDRDEAKAAIQNGKLDILITSRIFNQGIDIPELQCVVIASGYKAGALQIQRSTRGATKTEGKDDTIVIDCMDNFNDLLQKHSLERRKVCEKQKAYEIIDCHWSEFENKIDEFIKKEKSK